MTDNQREQLYRESPILEVAEKLELRLHGYGENSRATNCFAHEDKHPSLVLMPKVNRFECKSCGIKGDVISLVMGVKKIEFTKAVDWLMPGFKKEKGKTKPPYIDPQKFLEYRGIIPASAEKFGLKIVKHKNQDALEIPVATGKKYRFINPLNPNERFDQLPGTTACLFKTSGATDTVIFVEGELDAIKLWQETGYPVWTGTTGAGTFEAGWVADFAKIEKVYLALDNDSEGEKAKLKIAALLGNNRCYDIRVPMETGKDWTDFFRWGYSKVDFEKLLDKAESFDDNILKQFERDQKDNLAFRINSGFVTVDSSIGGFRSGAVYIIAGLKKCGKSSLTMSWIDHILSLGHKVGYLDTELSFGDFISRLAAIHNNLLLCQVEEDEKIQRRLAQEVREKLFRSTKEEVVDNDGLSIEKLERLLEDWVDRGVKACVIDNLTTFGNLAHKVEGWQEINRILDWLISFAKTHGIILFIVLHTHKSLVFSETPEGIRSMLSTKKTSNGSLQGPNPEKIFEESITINMKPTTADLYGGGGALSQVSGGVFLLWRPYQDYKNSDYQQLAELILSDFRHGAKKTEIRLNFQLPKLRFEETNVDFQDILRFAPRQDTLSSNGQNSCDHNRSLLRVVGEDVLCQCGAKWLGLRKDFTILNEN